MAKKLTEGLVEAGAAVISKVSGIKLREGSKADLELFHQTSVEEEEVRMDEGEGKNYSHIEHLQR